MRDEPDPPADETRRTPVDASRADDTPEWEVFLREASSEPLRHAGSVTASTAEVAHEQAGRLFPAATTLWLCPSGAVERFTERDLGAAYREGDSGATDPADDPTADAGGGERA
jgi:rSAM-partnered protein